MKLLILTALLYSFSSFASVPVLSMAVQPEKNGICSFNINGEGDVHSSFKAPCAVTFSITASEGNLPSLTFIDVKVDDAFFENSNNIYISDESLDNYLAGVDTYGPDATGYWGGGHGAHLLESGDAAGIAEDTGVGENGNKGKSPRANYYDKGYYYQFDNTGNLIKVTPIDPISGPTPHSSGTAGSYGDFDLDEMDPVR